MRYCKKCKKVYEDQFDKCDCGFDLTKDIRLNDNDPVFLISAYGFEKDRIIATLSDYKIPFEQKPYKKQFPLEIVTGYNDALINVYVPFCKLYEAEDLIIGITEDNQNLNKPSEDNFKKDDKTEDMSPRKRTFWRAVSLVLYLCLISLVVYLVDYVMALIKVHI